jgi:hypothetical protein
MTDVEDKFPTEVRVVFRRNEYLYRDYHIYFDPPPIPIRSCDWHWSHDDFDGAPDGNDHRYGHSASLADAKADIDEQIEEDGE